MITVERYLAALHTDDAAGEEPAATRERLREGFPRGATRRMTLLGMLVGSALDRLGPGPDDTIVYASGYAETRALEDYLDSFPTPSPTLFQTSIHPSAVQQGRIGRQQPVAAFFPLTGSAHLPARALQVALLAPAARVLLCGGEERGTWLLEQRAASDRSFGFAAALVREPTGALARVRLEPTATADPAAALALPAFFDLLHARRPVDRAIAPGWRLILEWA